MTEEVQIQEIDPHNRAIESEISQDRIPEENMEEYLQLIRAIVASIFAKSKIPPGMEFDDFMGFGYEGLVKAWRNFKNEKGALFKTYATYRIKGEVWDNIRREWKARNPSHNKLVRKEMIKEKIQKLARQTLDGAKDSSAEEAKHEALYSALSNSAIVYLLSLDSVENLSNSLKKDDVGDEVIGRFEKVNERVFLQEAIEKLDEKEARFVDLYYYKNKNQREISEIFQISKSQISRMHVKILNKLKHRISVKLKKEWTI